MEREYIFYRKKAGLDFDLYIKLHPEINGEKVFENFMSRYDAYIKQRNLIVTKFEKKFIDEPNLEKHVNIYSERMFAIAQLELVFNDVVRVFLGLDPEDDNLKFDDNISARYDNLTKEFLCEDKPGFYIGADGLYRLAYFYEDDVIPISCMKEFYALGDKVYKANTRQKPEIHLIIDGVEVEVPNVENIHRILIDTLVEMKKHELPPPPPPKQNFEIKEFPVKITENKKVEVLVDH